jgi:hypothetical protein
MTPEEYEWAINLVKDRYQRYKLSFEQAEKVYLFEQEKDLSLHSQEYLFSDWEEYDYLLDNFQRILNEKQFKKFLIWHKEAIRKHEEYLIESDKEETNYINYYQDLIDFYQENYIPDFYKERFLIQSVSLSTRHKAKVSFLKQEYKAYLDGEKAGLISSHYRHNRLFKPNTLKATLLRHKLAYIVPKFTMFKRKMDEPIKATAQFLLNEFSYIPERYDNFFKSKEEELSLFVKSIQAKYIGEPKDYVVTITETEQEAKESKIMQIVLMDIEQYGTRSELPKVLKED